MRAERRGHVSHRRIGQLGLLGEHVHGLALEAGAQQLGHLIDQLRRNAVGDHAEQRAALALERLAGHAGGLHDLARGGPAHHHQHGCVEQDREAGIQVEVERRRGAREVGALADDHVAAELKLAKGRHHPLLDLVEDAARDRRLALVV